MWMLKFIPDWFFYAIFFLGLGGLVVTYFLRLIPIPAIYLYKTPIQLASIVAIAFGTFMSGAIYNNDAWIAKQKELELEYAQSQVKSEKATTEVVTKFITKREVIREKGEDLVRYIDREIVKYNEICKLPKEAIAAHNKAVNIGDGRK